MSLKDKWIVITRPTHQAENLKKKLELAGANVVLFPLLEIGAPDNPSLVKQQLSNLAVYDLAIFFFLNAVENALNNVENSSFNTMKIAAIGEKTARVLKAYGLKVDIFPEKMFNSESLLKMPEMQWYGSQQKIVILRGAGGRNLLRDSLQAQGAKVDYIDVYQRRCPQTNLDALDAYYNQSQLDMILITSAGSLENLFQFRANYPWLNRVNLMVGSERIKHKAERMPGFGGDLLATQEPSDEAFYRRLLQWSNERRVKE